MARVQRRLRLSANPLDLEDPMMEEQPMGVPGEEEMYEDPAELEQGSMYRSRVRRGKPVRGPKTKLMASEAILDRMENAVVELAENQASMARSIAGLAKAVLTKADDDDDDDDSKEDKSRTASKDAGSDFQPYGGTKDDGSPEARNSEESTQNEAGLQDPKGTSEVGKAKTNKDDASGNYGEKDNDIPGNRQADVDEKDKPAEEYLIQGGPGDGTGPVSKAVQTELDNAVSSVLAKHGILKKAVGPAPGNATVETGAAPNMDELFDQARGMSFSDLNNIRVASGELPRTLI